jgi:CDP-diacylglycerol--serine O-phosphatidyltransferase
MEKQKSRFVKSIPNAITFINVIAGFVAVLVLYWGVKNAVYIATALFVVSTLADYFDGWAARKLGTTSQIGGFLDSYGDVLSFGIAPALLVNYMFAGQKALLMFVLSVASLVYIICGVYRLARFNLSHPTDHFVGLPILLAAAFIYAVCCTWYAVLGAQATGLAYVISASALCLVLAFFMVSHIKVKRLGAKRRARAEPVMDK